MLWYDTSNNILKMRSEADDAWIDIGTLNQSTNEFEVANLTELTETQAEDDTGTVFGLVSGERLGQSFTANEQQVGVGQTRTDVTSSRSVGTSYQNTTGKPISITIDMDQNNGFYNFEVSDDGTTWSRIQSRQGDGDIMSLTEIIQNGEYYRLKDFTGSLLKWTELR